MVDQNSEKKMRVVRLSPYHCLGIPWDIPRPGTLGSHKISQQFQVWDMLSIPSHCLTYLGISWDVPSVPALAHTRDWWDVHGIPRYHGTMGQDGQEGPSTWDWWDVPWDPKALWDNGCLAVPVDILQQSWTTMEKMADI